MEALVLFLIILVFGFFSFPLFSYFTLVGVYSFVFFDMLQQLNLKVLSASKTV